MAFRYMGTILQIGFKLFQFRYWMDSDGSGCIPETVLKLIKDNLDI